MDKMKSLNKIDTISIFIGFVARKVNSQKSKKYDFWIQTIKIGI